MTPQEVFEFFTPFLKPLDLLLTQVEKDELSITEFLGEIEKVLDLQSRLDDIVAPVEIKQQLITEVLRYIAISDYNMTEEQMDQPAAKSLFYKVSANWINTLKYFGSEMSKFANQDVVSLQNVFAIFKRIEYELSDENNLSRALVEYLRTTTEYDEYQYKISQDVYMLIGLIKDPINLDAVFPKEPHESYFKLASFLLNGIIDDSQWTEGENPLFEYIAVNDFENMYGSGMTLYSGKLILAMLEAYVLLQEKGTKEEQDAYLMHINDTSLTATLKAKESFSIIFKYSDPELLNIKFLVQKAYYLPVTQEFYDLFDNSQTNYEYYDNRRKEIEVTYGKPLDELLIDMLFKENASVVVPELIELNKSILTQLLFYQKEYASIFNIVMRDVNYSLFMTQLTKLYAFPESIGMFVVNSLKQITQEIENAEENNITIYADEGSLSAPYYNFYYDNNGKKVKIDFSQFSLIPGVTYTFKRLNNSTSHPLWIRGDFATITSSLGVNERMTQGITGSEYLAITLEEDAKEIEVYCTSHAIMVAKLAIDPTLSPVPCFTDTCSILTPDGYVEVSRLKEGDLVVTPEKKEVKIIKIMKPKTLAINGKTRPHLIPKHSIKPNVPFKDTYISLNHGYMENDQWKVPGKNMEANQVQWSSDSVTYYNIMLEDYPNHDLVVNGVTMECWGGANAQDSFGQENIPIRNKKLFG